MKRLCVIACVVLAAQLSMGGAGSSPGDYAVAAKSPARIAPVDPGGAAKKYAQLVADWWTWAISIPADQNPITDTTGEHGLVGQSGNVYFLAGNFGGTVTRELTVPTGKKLFFPLYNSVWWAPDDLAAAAFFAEQAGLDPALMTDEELIEFIATFSISQFSNLTLTINGQPVENLTDYFVVSEPFPLLDTDFIDTTGGVISQPNFAIGAGYWILLNPLPPGEYTIRFTVDENGPVFGANQHDVTYHLTVKPGGGGQ